jgi:hypothetical protein
MYLHPSSSPVWPALPVVVVIAVTTITAIAIAACLILSIARRAIEKASPDEVPAVILALTAMLGQLADYLPWSGQKDLANSPPRDSRAQTADNANDASLPEEES